MSTSFEVKISPQLIPHLYGQRVYDGQPIGRGVYKIVTVTQDDITFRGGEVAIVHNLDRIPQIMPEMVDFGPYPAVLQSYGRGIQPWTPTTIYIRFFTPGTYTLWVR